MKTFEEYLQDIFNSEGEYGGIGITKDNCEDMFDNWLQGLDADEWLEYGDTFAKLQITK